MGFLDDVPLPSGDALLGASAAATIGAGALCLVAPKKLHELYFSDEDGNNKPMPAVHKPTTRWMGMSLGWVGALNVAAALAPDGDAKKKLLVANGVGLLGGLVMDGVQLAKGTQKKKTTAAEMAACGTLGVLNIARAIKGCDKKGDDV